MSVDPSHFLATSNGGKPPLLKLQNISAKPELNSLFGQAVSYSAGRYVVAIITAEIAATMAGGNNAAEPSYLKLKPENLIEATNFEQLKFGAAVAFHHVQLLLKSQAFQQRGSYIMSLLPSSIQAKLTPEKAVMGAAIVILLNIMLVLKFLSRWIGVTKFFVFFSLIALVLTISAPDWTQGVKEGKPLKLIAKSALSNSPKRFKQLLIEMTGRNISDKVALFLLIAILLWIGKTLLTPLARPARQYPPMPNGGMQQRAHRDPQYNLEQIYKLGWDDARAGKDFGISLTEDILKDTTAEEYNRKPRYQESFDWAYDPLPPPKRKSSFSMATILSIFSLYRFGKEIIITPGGQLNLDPAYIMMRLRNMEPWRLGVMGLSLYRFVNAFLR